MVDEPDEDLINIDVDDDDDEDSIDLEPADILNISQWSVAVRRIEPRKDAQS